MKIKYYVLLTSIILFQSCKSNYQTPNNIGQLALEISAIDTNKIRFDGIYNVYDTSLLYSGEKANEAYVTINDVVFTKNGFVHRGSGVTTDSIHFTKESWLRSCLKFNYLWGNYITVGDSIYAYTQLEMFIRGGRLKPFYANFSGYIKNRDTILNWRMVRPYPKVNPEWNQNFINDTTPRMLYFIKNDAVKCLDTLLKH